MKRGIAISVLLIFAFIASCSFAAAELRSPEISMTMLNQNPDPVKQGDVVEVRFKIENLGLETADDILVQLVADYPFSLYNGKSIVNVGKLRAAQSGADAVIVRYKLRVDEGAVEGDNEVKLKVKIGQNEWQDYTENDFMINVQEYNFPEIKAYVRETDIISAGTKGKVTIEIANTHLENVKFMQLTLMPNEGYQILSPSNYVYIGQVDSDDTETEEFELYVENTAKDSLILPVKLEYQDSNEKKYEKEFMVSVRVYSAEEAKQLGLSKSSTVWNAVAGAALLIIIGYVFWRRRKKK